MSARRAAAAALVSVAALVPSACGRQAASAGAEGGARPVAASSASAARAIEPMDAKEESLWTRAEKTDDADDLSRLADWEGESGLRARADEEPTRRYTALRALGYAPDPGAFASLPYLARAAKEGPDREAFAALDATLELAARPRRALDPEDAAELKEGCDALLAFAGGGDAGKDAPRPRRVKAIRALRMLADRGCVDPRDIPTDLDANGS